ncbi:MAG: hypothetical protein LUD15_07720 [Bacteroides sp.]|nr:hypothetical protein [Bacteroides sp.]
MKRYSSRYFCFVADHKVFRNTVVKVLGERRITLFPLREEIEATRWIPGAILLLDTFLYASLQQKEEELVNRIDRLIKSFTPLEEEFRFTYTLREGEMLCTFSRNSGYFIPEPLSF